MSISQESIDKFINLLEQENAADSAVISVKVEEIKRRNNEINELKSGVFNASSNFHVDINGTIKADSSKKVTLRKIMLDMFDDGIPRTSNEIRLKSNKINKKDTTAKPFSAPLSQVVNKGNDFKLHRGEEGNYYGLKKWFDGEYLKPEYIEKIQKNKEEQLLITSPPYLK